MRFSALPYTGPTLAIAEGQKAAYEAAAQTPGQFGNDFGIKG